MRTTGINGLTVKQRNRGLVLKLIACGHASSRTELAQQTGLTKMTVSNIISDFLEGGYLQETSFQYNGKRGCNPIGITLSPTAPQALAVSISRNRVASAAVNLSGQIQGEPIVLSLQAETAATLKYKMLLAATCAIERSDCPILGIGVASVGPVHAEDGVLLNPVNFFGIEEFDIKRTLAETFRVPVAVNNDMNAATMAERLYGIGQAYQNFVYVGLANGVGAGIMSNGTLYYNPNGFSSELGHACVDLRGRLCACGNRGCLETYASISVVTRALKKACRLERMPTPQEFEYLYHHPAGRAVFDRFEAALTTGLVNLANFFSPQAIIIGHDGFYLPDELMTHIEEQLNRRVIFAGHQHIKLLRSSFQNQAFLPGAACCIFRRLFDGSWSEEWGLDYTNGGTL